MKTERSRWIGWLLCAMLLVLAGAVFLEENKSSTKKKETYSVILYQDMENEWTMLEEGARQAEDDLGISVNYITLAEGATAEEQLQSIKDEIEGNTKGILLAATDSEGLKTVLEGEKISVPLMYAETGAGDDMRVIRADDYGMGKLLAEALLQDLNEDSSETKTIVLLAKTQERDSVQKRIEGFKAALQEAQIDAEYVELLEDSAGGFEAYLRTTKAASAANYVAAFDKYSTQQAADLWYSRRQEAPGMQVSVYGCGNTAGIVNALDNEKIKALVYQNEFSVGYLGLKALVEKRNSTWIEENISIQYQTVTKDTLYESDHARMLFSNN